MKYLLLTLATTLCLAVSSHARFQDNGNFDQFLRDQDEAARYQQLQDQLQDQIDQYNQLIDRLNQRDQYLLDRLNQFDPNLDED